MSESTKLQGNSELQNGGIPLKSNEDFSYLHQSQTGYGMQPTEPYIASYYGTNQVPFPYMNEWSAGDSVPYLSGYNNETQHPPPFIPDNNMFAPSANLGNGGPQFFGQQPMFSQGSDFTAWGSPSIEPQRNQQTPYNADFYQHSIMPHSYLGGELLSNSSNDFQRYNNVAIGNEITAKLPPVSEPTPPVAMNSLDQNFQSMKIEGGDAEKLPQKPDNNSSINIGLVQNGLNDNHENGTIKPVTNEPSAPAKPISWAAIASKPAKPQPKPKKAAPAQGLPPPVKHNMDIGTWDGPKAKDHNGNTHGNNQPHKRWNGQRQGHGHGRSYNNDKSSGQDRENYSHKNKPSASTPADPVLEKLKTQNEYNPKQLSLDTTKARFFVIKSYSEDDIHRSIKYNIWCSTEHGNKRLDAAFHDQLNRGPIVLLYSVNGSGHFCGVAEMKTKIDYSTSAGVWCQDKWKGSFTVKWIYVKDVPNAQLRHIKLENNENKPVTNSRDTQEVPFKKGRDVLQIIANYKHQTSIFDDFGHYEQKQLVEEDQKSKSAQQREQRKTDGNQHGNHNNNRQRR